MPHGLAALLYLFMLLVSDSWKGVAAAHICNTSHIPSMDVTILPSQLVLCSKERKKKKLEMLGGIVWRLASPREILGVKFFLSTQDSIKHPEMHKKVNVGKIF